MSKKNEQDPRYKTDRGKEIEHTEESLYDVVTLYFSQIEQYINVLEMIDFHKGPGLDIESYQFFLADMGRILIKDIEGKFTALYDFIEKEVGDIRIDSAMYGQDGIEGHTFLGAYIEKKEMVGLKVKAVSGAKG